MIENVGSSRPHSVSVSRRDALRAGVLGFGFLGLGQLSLADLLRAESAAGIRSSNKAVIQIHLDGGPPQQDLIDLKPGAPAEIRGEFQPIATRIPGFSICELMPRLASIADRFGFIRSLVGSAGAHDAFQCQSGFEAKSLASLGGRPALGCVVSKLQGSTSDVVPAFVDLLQGRALVRDSARPGFLGPAHKPFRPDISKLFPRPLEDGMKRELAARGGEHMTSLSLSLAADRLQNRTELLASLDCFRRDVDVQGMMAAVDRFHEQAASILTSGRFADALDFGKIDARELERYTAPEPRLERFTTADDHRSMRKLLLARRLVEAGARCVSVSFSDFDTHSNNFQRLRHMLPILDLGLHALVTDLQERDLLDDVTIVVWGEFGRTPKINKSAGRDHWPAVGMAMLAGGGIRGGQVLGATDRTASQPVERPIHYKDVIASLYHNLGIQPQQTTIQDPSGRPQYLLDHGEPIRELL